MISPSPGPLCLAPSREACNEGEGDPPLYVNVNMFSGQLMNTWIDSLQAFFPGLQVLGHAHPSGTEGPAARASVAPACRFGGWSCVQPGVGVSGWQESPWLRVVSGHRGKSAGAW